MISTFSMISSLSFGSNLPVCGDNALADATATAYFNASSGSIFFSRATANAPTMESPHPTVLATSIFGGFP